MSAHAQKPEQRPHLSEEEKIQKARFGDTYYAKEGIERSKSFGELFPLVENMESRYNYDITEQLKGGTFSEVYKVRCQETAQEYGMKTLVKRSKDGTIPKTFLSELLYIYDLDHQNIVKFRTCCSNEDSEGHTRFHLIFELCLFDLGWLLFESKACITVENRKTMAWGLLSGLKHIHSKQIIHRDLKPCNLLISTEGCLRIADFGQATYIGERAKPIFSCRIGTPGYVAPEILFGAVKYGTQVDVWSAGIIIAEMFIKKKLIHGKTRQEQIAYISAALGTINEEIWPNCETLPYWNAYRDALMIRGRGRMTDSLYNYAFYEKQGGAMVRKMLRMCPRSRITIQSARSSLWFRDSPFAAGTIEDCLQKIEEGVVARYPPPSSDDEPPMWH